ncbi:Decarbamoylnovobiocin carbamoyltransferase [Planctomycetaceae bacterium]|nr:Decarbamoylnovobiocin carbamoyltransferase [Planctomycetaceae bacterium]
MNVLGIHDGRDPCVALLRDGALTRIGCETDFADEPFEISGFPARAVDQVLATERLRPEAIDVIAYSGLTLPVPRSRRELLQQFAEAGTFRGATRRLWRVAVAFGEPVVSRRDRLAPLEKLGLRADKSTFIDHHLAQAALAAASTRSPDGRVLVLVCEGNGDSMCASVHVSRGGRLDRVATIPSDNSLGNFLETLTYMLGMVPERDEPLLMELGGLAQGPQVTKVHKRLSILFEFDPLLPLNWRRTGNLPETGNSVEFMRNHLRRRRFDHIAGATRCFLEEFLAQWIDRCALKTACDHVALTGSVFGLRALYPALTTSSHVAKLSISPVPTDAGNATGAAIMAVAEKYGVEHVLPLGQPWLGADASESDCADFARQQEQEGGAWVDRPDDAETRTAELLAGGALLGRVRGRVDLARCGFGNRSLLGRGDLPEVRRAAAQLLRPDVFWLEVPTIVLDTEIDTLFEDAEKVPRGVLGEYWLRPRRGMGYLSQSAVPVQITVEAADPAMAQVIKAFRKASGRTPLICAPWITRRGTLVRTLNDARDAWRDQNLDGVVAGPFVVLRKSAGEGGKPKAAELARRPFFGGL